MNNVFLTSLAFTIIILIALPVHSQETGGRMHKEHHTMHGDEMPAHCMHHEMMIIEIMEAMNTVMGIQKKILSGTSPSERKELTEELSTMMEKMNARIASVKR